MRLSYPVTLLLCALISNADESVKYRVTQTNSTYRIELKTERSLFWRAAPTAYATSNEAELIIQALPTNIVTKVPKPIMIRSKYQ